MDAVHFEGRAGNPFLTAGIGNIHGKYPENWAGLNFERLGEIKEAIAGKARRME